MTTRTPTKSGIRRALLTAYDKANDKLDKANAASRKARVRAGEANTALVAAKKACADAGLKVDEPSGDAGGE